MTVISAEIKERLVQLASQVRENAYAPYSKYRVGAAVLLADGSIETGINVENASYGLSICAERVALTTAVAKGKRDFAAIAVVTSSDEAASPCGACRQFMSEFNPELLVIMANDKGATKTVTLDKLLPMQFDKSFLGQ